MEVNSREPGFRLSQSTLNRLPPEVRKPRYDRRGMFLETVHIGVGGFHRAHQCQYMDDLLDAGRSDWGECGLGILPQDRAMQEALAPQDGLFTVLTRSAGNEMARVIGALGEYVYAAQEPELGFALLTSPRTRIVSLTVTEGGYFVDPVAGGLNAGDPRIQNDLDNPQQPQTVLGYLAEALHRRRAVSEKPFTVMSCDNLPGNGDVLRRVLLEFAERRGGSLARWIERNVTFPNSMVDGITPVTRDSDRTELQQRFGFHDAWPVVTEPFRQWVLEDKFCNGRPPFEEAGVQLTSDVAPYEKMKLRLLNAGHSALGYLGALRGYEFVHEAVRDPLLCRYLRDLLDDVTPLIPAPAGIDLKAYKTTLIDRFSNEAIRDQITRICSEGSAKLPKFVLPSIEELQERGRPAPRLSLVVAAWLRYLTGRNEAGASIEVIDDRAAELAGESVASLLRREDVFGRLCRDERFAEEVKSLEENLQSKGSERVLRDLEQRS